MAVSLLTACDVNMPAVESFNVAVVETSRTVADRSLLVDVARDFYADHPDAFDMLVLWGTPEFTTGFSYYQPVRNDVSGIGYRHEEQELFDRSAEFGSSHLQGIIWMGPNWLTSPQDAGHEAVLKVLVHETAHRWASSVYFQTPEGKAPSSALLGRPDHWSFLLDTGASPLGGNAWIRVSDTEYQAAPVDEVRFSALDLYLMGLLPPAEVAPITLLTNAHRDRGQVSGGVSALGRRVTEPLTVFAEPMTITIEQIIEAEGPRNTATAFNASRIQQAWILVTPRGTDASAATLARLAELQSEWGEYFSGATDHRGAVDMPHITNPTGVSETDAGASTAAPDPDSL